MKIAILGYGVEGKSVERYFAAKGDEISIFDEENGGTRFEDLDLGEFDLVFRSPSVNPRRLKNGNITSVTKYFFDKCAVEIIGVTATKGKGTICSMIKSILSVHHKVWLVGNIGEPALDVLDEVEAGDVVVYEMSSFQLWDMEKSPAVAVVGRIEPDHLNVHEGMDDYVAAKTRIVRYQGKDDKVIYYKENELSRRMGEESRAGKKMAYPDRLGAHMAEGWFWFGETKILERSSLKLPGGHNVENALAAIAVCFGMVSVDDIRKGLSDFRGLPHRLELVRELDGVKYYDDNFASATPATEVAVRAFDGNVILIVGGFDRGLDYTGFVDFLNGRNNLKKVILMGQTAEKMSLGLNKDFELAESLEEAVAKAQQQAEGGDTVVMSPGAASFDMFENFEERASRYQKIVKEMM